MLLNQYSKHWRRCRAGRLIRSDTFLAEARLMLIFFIIIFSLSSQQVQARPFEASAANAPDVLI